MNKKVPSILLVVFGILSLNSYAQVKSISFDELKTQIFENKSDSIIVINFWATWCAPCIQELPSFATAQDSLHDEKVKFIFLSLDFPGSEERVKKVFTTKHLTGEVLLLNESDGNTWINKLDPEWQGNIPVTWLVNPKTKAEHFHIGTVTEKTLISFINNIK